MRGKIAVLALALMSCVPNPETAHVAVNPSTAPVRTITSFNDALHCMDDLFAARGIKDVYITSAGVPDATGAIAAGTKDMLITAISQMSAKSNAFRYIDYDPTQLDVQIMSEMAMRNDFILPTYYVRGAISQYDPNVLSSSNSAAISAPYVDLSISHDQVVSVISVDMNLGKLVSRQILAGMSASNSISVVRSGKGADAGATVGKGGGTTGISFNVALDKSEGFHQAVRNLIELSTIEILGKLTHTPYWQCLKLDQTSPNYRNQAREWFDAMQNGERVRFVKTNLTRMGYYRGTNDEQLNSDLSESVARYQAEHDVVPNGRIDFDLYYRLLGDSNTAARETVAVPTMPVPEPTQAAALPAAPHVQLQSVRGGSSVHVHDRMLIKASMTQDGFLYCYYQDADNVVARIFPNRFQSDAFVHAGAPVNIPPGTQPFEITFDKPHAKEAVACVASSLELGIKLPEALKKQDLVSLPVHNLNEVLDAFRQLGPINEGRLQFEVN